MVSKYNKSSSNDRVLAAGKDIAGITNVVNKTALDLIKERSVILTDADIEQMKQKKEEERKATQHEAQERKRRMLAKELEVRKRREQSAFDMEIEAERNAVLTNDAIHRHQHLKSIQQVNSLALQAKGYLLCDMLQVNQQKQAQIEANYNQLHDNIMKRDCNVELQERREKKARDHEKRMEARADLEKQIADRQKKAIWEAEAKDIEAQKMLNLYKQYDVEAQQKKQQHQEHVRKTIVEVAKTNQQIKSMKDAMKQHDKHEELVAAAYLRKKAMEEEAKIQEAARIHKSKEIRIAKLREQQERAQDKQALQDEYRAKREMESIEEAILEKEEQDREQKGKLMQEILKDRKKQEEFHKQMKNNINQYDMNIDTMMKQRTDQEYEAIKAKKLASQEINMHHGQLLQEQIALKQHRIQKSKIFEQEDARFLKKKALKESILAEKVRVSTIANLEKQNVPQAYLRELKHMQITEHNA